MISDLKIRKVISSDPQLQIKKPKSECLEWNGTEPNIVNSVINGDESCILQNRPTTKRHSIQQATNMAPWQHPPTLTKGRGEGDKKKSWSCFLTSWRGAHIWGAQLPRQLNFIVMSNIFSTVTAIFSLNFKTGNVYTMQHSGILTWAKLLWQCNNEFSLYCCITCHCQNVNIENITKKIQQWVLHVLLYNNDFSKMLHYCQW